MKTSFRFVPHILFVTFCAIATAACGGTAESTDSMSDDLSAKSSLPAGHYTLNGTQEPHSDEWIDDVVLVGDGTFDATFGSGVSNLSGHEFPAAGTYKVTSKGSTETIVFTYEVNDVASSSTYAFKRNANGSYEVSVVESDPQSPQQAFSMDFAADARTAVIAFNSDFSVKQTGSLVAGGLLEVRYDVAREKCASANGTLGAFVSVDGSAAQGFLFPEEKGSTVEIAIPIVQGKNLSIWFENQSPGCTYWDSKFGQNFQFAIQAE